MDEAEGDGAQEEARPIEGLVAWRQALRELLFDPGAELWMYSDDYEDWPLDEPEVVQALTRWALPRRRACAQMLARDYSKLMVNFSRFVQWRGDFSHIIECRELAPELEAPSEGLWVRGRAAVALPALRTRRATWVQGREWQASQHVFAQAWDLAEPGFVPRPPGL